jgi:hypothetical protein
MYHSVTCSCLLWTHRPGREAGVHSFRRFIWKWKDPSCKEQNALLSCKQMSKLFPFQLSTTNFFQEIVRRLFELSFINGHFSLELLCNQKFQLTLLNTTNNWCTKQFTAVVSWGLIGQGRRLGFTVVRVSHKKEMTTHARNRMFFCHSILLGNSNYEFLQKKLAGEYLNWAL